jgi:hypothetical protein
LEWSQVDILWSSNSNLIIREIWQMFRWWPYLEIIFILKEYEPHETIKSHPKGWPSKREVSCVQSKLDVLVLETECFSFLSFNQPRIRTYPFTPIHFPSSRTIVGMHQMSFLGDFKSPPRNSSILVWILIPKDWWLQFILRIWISTLQRYKWPHPLIS